MNQTSQELRYHKVMLKLSGEALAGDKGFGIAPEVVDRLTQEIGSVASMGVSLGVVIGGGNIVRGAIASRSGMDRVQADYMGMLATVINALGVQDLLEPPGGPGCLRVPPGCHLVSLGGLLGVSWKCPGRCPG